MNRIPGRLALAGLALAAILVACFSEHSEPATDNSALCSSPPGSLVNGSTLVTIREFTFEPQNAQIQAGSSVVWVNCESTPTDHTSSSDQGAWDSPLLAPDNAFTQTFSSAGAYPYHCAPHPFMTATVTVE
jgi:plastocyanin